MDTTMDDSPTPHTSPNRNKKHRVTMKPPTAEAAPSGMYVVCKKEVGAPRPDPGTVIKRIIMTTVFEAEKARLKGGYDQVRQHIAKGYWALDSTEEQSVTKRACGILLAKDNEEAIRKINNSYIATTVEGNRDKNAEVILYKMTEVAYLESESSKNKHKRKNRPMTPLVVRKDEDDCSPLPRVEGGRTKRHKSTAHPGLSMLAAASASDP